MHQVEGNVDQSAGMLDEEIKEKGYALLCVSEPRSNCKIKVIDEVCSSAMRNGSALLIDQTFPIDFCVTSAGNAAFQSLHRCLCF